MKNLRKAVYVAMAIMLVFSLGGCVAAYNTPGAQTGTTGYNAIGTGTAVVPGTSAITGTNTGYGTNLGANMRRIPGINVVSPGTNVVTNPRTNLVTNPGANRVVTPGGNMVTTPGTVPAPNVIGTVGAKGYRDGIYTAATGSEKATVTINNGRIVKLDLGGGANTAKVNAIKAEIRKQVMARQDGNVVIKGASKTTSNWISAVKKALDKSRRV